MEISNNGKLLQIRENEDLILIDVSFVYEVIIKNHANGKKAVLDYICEGKNPTCSEIPNSSEEKHIPFTHEELKSFIQEKENEIGLEEATITHRFSLYLDNDGNIVPISRKMIVLCDKSAKRKEDLKFFVLDKSRDIPLLIEVSQFKVLYRKIKNPDYSGFIQQKEKEIIKGLGCFLFIRQCSINSVIHKSTGNKYKVETLAYSPFKYAAEKDKEFIIDAHPLIKTDSLYVIYYSKNDPYLLFLRPLLAFRKKFEIDTPF